MFVSVGIFVVLSLIREHETWQWEGLPQGNFTCSTALFYLISYLIKSQENTELYVFCIHSEDNGYTYNLFMQDHVKRAVVTLKSIFRMLHYCRNLTWRVAESSLLIMAHKNEITLTAKFLPFEMFLAMFLPKKLPSPTPFLNFRWLQLSSQCGDQNFARV